MEETRRQLKALYAMKLRELIDTANKKGIEKGDIVDIIKEDGTFILLYFK